MRNLGFSTGALFKSDFARSLAASRALGLNVIEFSALRTRELEPLSAFLEEADFTGLDYVSLHAPTDYSVQQEAQVAQSLHGLALKYRWPVVVHPDCLKNRALWDDFGEMLCIENMDKRKSVGRTVEELVPLFERFPSARMCFDIAHAHQVDTSMTEAYRILRTFADRICQLHVSEVTSSSKHERISETALTSFQDVANHLPQDVPVILETPVTLSEAASEINQAARIFEPIVFRRSAAHA